jgi:prevent-host-death family protein
MELVEFLGDHSAPTRVLQCSTMKSIGVRELRQRASEYLREVEAGRAMEITARGRTVALLVPVRKTDHVERLVSQGRVLPPTGDLLKLGAPLAPGRGVRRPSEMLARARARER